MKSSLAPQFKNWYHHLKNKVFFLCLPRCSSENGKSFTNNLSADLFAALSTFWINLLSLCSTVLFESFRGFPLRKTLNYHVKLQYVSLVWGFVIALWKITFLSVCVNWASYYKISVSEVFYVPWRHPSFWFFVLSKLKLSNIGLLFPNSFCAQPVLCIYCSVKFRQGDDIFRDAMPWIYSKSSKLVLHAWFFSEWQLYNLCLFVIKQLSKLSQSNNKAW